MRKGVGGGGEIEYKSQKKRERGRKSEGGREREEGERVCELEMERVCE